MDVYLACLSASGDYKKDDRAPRAAACESEFRERAQAKEDARRREGQPSSSPPQAAVRQPRPQAAVGQPRPPATGRSQREEAAPTPEQVIALRFAVFEDCSAAISSRTPVLGQKQCYDVGEHLYYCFLGPAKDYCERQYRGRQDCRGCRERVGLHGRITRTLSALGWKGFLGPRFKAVR